MSPHIMVYGNPVDGFRFVGPFETKRQAHTYATTESADAWVAELDAPISADIERKTWDIHITKTDKGYAWTTDFAGDGFDPTADAMVVAIAKCLTAYIEPAINRSIITDLVALGEKVRREKLGLDTPTPDIGRRDHDALLAIQELLDGVEWRGAETLGDIAQILRDAGYRIRDLDDNDVAPKQPTAVEDYAAWLERQPKPKTMAEALAQLPPGVRGAMMDPDKPEIVHNVIADAVGERYHQLPPSQTINQEGEWK